MWCWRSNSLVRAIEGNLPELGVQSLHFLEALPKLTTTHPVACSHQKLLRGTAVGNQTNNLECTSLIHPLTDTLKCSYRACVLDCWVTKIGWQGYITSPSHISPLVTLTLTIWCVTFGNSSVLLKLSHPARNFLKIAHIPECFYFISGKNVVGFWWCCYLPAKILSDLL